MSDTPQTLPHYAGPPDVTKDKLLVVTGGVILTTTAPILLTDYGQAWLTYFTPDTDHYPREKHARVLNSVHVGTVDQLVELYRRGLTAAYESLVVKQPDGEPPVPVPFTGEASLRLQNSALTSQFGHASDGCAVPCTVSVEQYEQFVASRYEKYEQPKPRQLAAERDALMRMVAAYLSGRHPPPEVFDPAHPVGRLRQNGFVLPTDDPAAVQLVIDRLVVLREDAEARHKAQAATAEARD